MGLYNYCDCLSSEVFECSTSLRETPGLHVSDEKELICFLFAYLACVVFCHWFLSPFCVGVECGKRVCQFFFIAVFYFLRPA